MRCQIISKLPSMSLNVRVEAPNIFKELSDGHFAMRIGLASLNENEIEQVVDILNRVLYIL